MTLEEIAASIFASEFDSDTSVTSASAIEVFVSANLSVLNEKLDEALTEDDLTETHCGIFAQMYLEKFYRAKARQAAAGYDTEIISIKEGDTEYQGANKVEVAKNFRSMSKDATDELSRLISDYKRNRSRPQGFVTGELNY